MNKRPLYKIAVEIKQDWKNPYFGAKPYIEALLSLSDISETYLCDSAYGIVLGFLSNASTWKGECAKHIKAELKSLVRDFEKSSKF